MPQRLEKDERYAVGKIERPGGRIEHGDAQPVIAMLFEERFWKARSFSPKDEIIIGTESDVGIAFGSVGFDEPQDLVRRKLRFERSPIFPSVPGNVLPIVHAGAFELRVVQLEAEGFDQVQGGASGRAEPGDISSVGRNFRFKQDDVHDS